jgi:hypothetical protein
MIGAIVLTIADLGKENFALINFEFEKNINRKKTPTVVALKCNKKLCD